MSTVNKAILIGRLGKDPELRYTASGQAVTNLALATNEKWTGKDGKKEERTEWHRVVVFGKSAESTARFLKKGATVFTSGRIQTKSYEKDGKTLYSTEVLADEVKFLDRSDGETPKPSEVTEDEGIRL